MQRRRVIGPPRPDAALIGLALDIEIGRHQLTEPIFWKVFELCPPAERYVRMREWFLSEFSPGTSAAPLDEKIGVVDEKEHSGLIAEYRRLQRYCVTEPDSPV